MNAATSRSVDAGVVRIDSAIGFPRAEQRAVAPRHEKQIAARTASGRRAPRRRRRASVTRFIAFSIGMPVDDAERLQQPIDAGAGRVDGDARGDVERARAPSDVAGAARRPRAGRRRRAARSPRRGSRAPRRARRAASAKREGEPIRLGRDVVVDRRPRRSGPAAAGRESAGSRGCRETRRGRPAGGATTGTPRLRPTATRRSSSEARRASPSCRASAIGRAAARRRAGGPRAARSARSSRRSRTDSRARAEVERLQVAQAAVNRAQVVERRAAAEVVALDRARPTARAAPRRSAIVRP